MELTKAQKEIVNATESQVVVISAAASGKTTVLVERVRHLLNIGVNPRSIVLITFTNAAAEEIGARLQNPNGVFIGTIHSYANYLLCAKCIDTQKAIATEQFDDLFEQVRENPECIQPVDYLLLDEAQDSTENQFEFLLDMVKPNHYMLVGDFRQSIYRWNGAYPDFILNLTHDPFVATYYLNENYRNGSRILDFARDIINLAGYEYRDNSIPMRGLSGRVEQIDFDANVIAKAVQTNGDFKDWFILARTNDEVDTIYNYLQRQGIPCDTFKRASLDMKEFNERMSANTVKVLTIHTSKGLEAPNVIVVGARFYNLEERCVSYVAATRAKNILLWTRPMTKKKVREQIFKFE